MIIFFAEGFVKGNAVCKRLTKEDTGCKIRDAG
jgi:hypothetical protein